MAAARRMMKENLPDVDLCMEVLDARIPLSSRNPEIASLLNGKPSLLVLNKADLASQTENEAWKRSFEKSGYAVVFADSKLGRGTAAIYRACENLLKEKLERKRAKGMEPVIRAMIVGIPNVGKSTLINSLCGAKKARAENRPGVTKTKQWVKAGKGLELLDMPGVLWPKFEDARIGENLAMTGAIKDNILQTDEIAVLLCRRLAEAEPVLLQNRYRLSAEDLALEPYELFLKIGKKRGLIVRGGEVDEERCAAMLLEEFRSAAIGRITLEKAADYGF